MLREIELFISISILFAKLEGLWIEIAWISGNKKYSHCSQRCLYAEAKSINQEETMCEIQFDLICDRWNFWKLERDEQKNVAFLKNDKISCYLTDTKYMTFKKKISALISF